MNRFLAGNTQNVKFVFCFLLLLCSSCLSSEADVKTIPSEAETEKITKDVELAKSHLELIQRGKSSEARDQYCFPSDELRLFSVNAYDVTETDIKTFNSTDFNYTEVLAEVQSKQTRRDFVKEKDLHVPKTFPLTQVSLEIWNSDEFYERIVLTNNKINETTAGSSEALRTSRSSVNSEESCVFLPFSQFDATR